VQNLLATLVLTKDYAVFQHSRKQSEATEVDILLYTVLGTVIGTAIAMLLISEGGGSLTRLSRRIVERVISEFPEELPEQLRRRWSEEIRGDLETFARAPIRGLLFARKLRREGARRLAAELVLDIAVSTPARSSRDTNPYASIYRTPIHTDWITNEYAPELRKHLEEFEVQKGGDEGK